MTASARESSLTLERGLALLQAVADADAEAPTVSDLAAAIGVSRAAVYRLLVPLESRGLVRRSGSRVRLGLGVLHLAARVLPPLRTRAVPVLRALAEQLGATAHLTVADGAEVQAVAVAEPSWTDVHVAYRVGRRHALGAGAAGRAVALDGSGPRWSSGSGPDSGPGPGSGSGSGSEPGTGSGEHGVAAPVRGVPGLTACVGVVSLRLLDEAVVGPRVVGAAGELSALLADR